MKRCSRRTRACGCAIAGHERALGAWSLAVFGISLTALYHILDLMNGHRFAPSVVGTIVGIAVLLVGAVIASHRPRNPIAWI